MHYQITEQHSKQKTQEKCDDDDDDDNDDDDDGWFLADEALRKAEAMKLTLQIKHRSETL